jgi:ketosteroid isomerase-like protein
MRAWLLFSTLLLLSAAQADPPRSWSYDSMRQGQQQSETAQTQPTEEQQLAALLATMVDRWNAHDIEGYMETLWNSPDLLCVVDGEEVMGWSNLLASYLRGYPDRTAMGSVRTERTLIQPITENVAFAVDWWRATFGANSHSVYATSTYLLRKIPQEGWKIAAVHTSFVEP